MTTRCDGGVAQRVRTDSLADSGSPGDAENDPPGGVPVEAPAGGVYEDRPVVAMVCQGVMRSAVRTYSESSRTARVSEA